MARLLALATLILSLVLFPPATLAYLSQDAVPGDRMYPIKRGFEDVILTVTSINPWSKAFVATARIRPSWDLPQAFKRALTG